MNEIDLTGFARRLIEKMEKHQAERDAVTGKDMVFTIEPYEQKVLADWLAQHKDFCTVTDGGAAGGSLTYQFTPTGIGMATIVECACGQSVNITDYEQW